MRRIVAAAVIAFSAPAAADPNWTPPPAKEGFSYPECYCTNRGEKVAIGDLTCLRVGGRVFTAQCDMSVNNPIWREVQDGCTFGPAASLDGAPSLLERLERLQPG